MLAGFQAAGTRGNALENGASEIKIHGDMVPVMAQVKVLDNISGHADYNEIIQWFSQSKIKPKRVFVTHGESAAAEEFKNRLGQKFDWNVSVPAQDEVFVCE